MSKSVICVDAMGGDFAPVVTTKGVVKALNKNNNIEVILVGREDLILANLNGLEYDKSRLKIVNATEIIENEDSPVKAIKEKKDSSMIVGLNIVKNNEAEAFVSAGSTGALLAGSTTILGRIKGVKRPCLAVVLPNEQSFSLLLDAGANVDTTPEYLEQFAIMGSAYTEKILNVANPRVSLLNNGSEETKGNQLTKDTYKLLKESKLNFTGNVEPNEISKGATDVIVCDGFYGNIVLKLSEGLVKSFNTVLKKQIKSSKINMLGAMIAKKAFKGLKQTFDIEKVGGAPFLGLNSLVVKAHGSSSEDAIMYAVLQADKFIQSKFNENLAEALKSE